MVPAKSGRMHVRLADDAFALSTQNGLPYLDIDQILARAADSGANAVHPGYGFLAENAVFAQRCCRSRDRLRRAAGVRHRCHGKQDRGPCYRGAAPGCRSCQAPGNRSPASRKQPKSPARLDFRWRSRHPRAAEGADSVWRIRLTRSKPLLPAATGEATRYFGNPAVYAERYLGAARHIEVQLMADRHGNAVWLGERDCSVQRRHQKLIEEAPAVGLQPETRQALGEAAIALARAVGYENAGTVEFMVEPSGEFFFLEMNTRIQVEHTITEETTGIDLVREQLLVAMGEPLSFSQDSIETRGHAIQLRINAEDPGRDFTPMPGVIEKLRFPLGPGVRIDSAAEPGSAVLPAYDSLIAKLVLHGRNRDEALARARRALDEFEIGGVPSTIDFHRCVLDEPTFIAGGVTTRYLSDHPEVIPPAWEGTVGAPAESGPAHEQIVEVNGRRFSVKTFGDAPRAPAPTGKTARAAPKRNAAGTGAAGHGGADLISPIQGTVLRVGVERGRNRCRRRPDRSRRSDEDGKRDSRPSRRSRAGNFGRTF